MYKSSSVLSFTLKNIKIIWLQLFIIEGDVQGKKSLNSWLLILCQILPLFLQAIQGILNGEFNSLSPGTWTFFPCILQPFTIP